MKHNKAKSLIPNFMKCECKLEENISTNREAKQIPINTSVVKTP